MMSVLGGRPGSNKDTSGENKLMYLYICIDIAPSLRHYMMKMPNDILKASMNIAPKKLKPSINESVASNCMTSQQYIHELPTT
jgi:hypothetical protein